MEEAQKQPGSKQQPGEMQEGDIHGRIYNTNNPEFEKRPTQNDISHVDQQEGNMAHGEKGPALDREKEEHG